MRWGRYILKILAKSHAFLDRFRSKQFCGFLLLWADDWAQAFLDRL